MHSLLQDTPLTIRCLFDRLERIFPERQVATAADGKVVRRRSYSELARRARQLSSALEQAGVGAGQRVATFAFNTDDHLEQMIGIMAAGRVYHALNPRLHRTELEYIVNHARDVLVFVDEALLHTWQALDEMPSVRHLVVVRNSEQATGDLNGLQDYEAFLDSANSDCAWQELDERAAAALCYTSGTTGAPKGVVYSHRGLVLVALAWMTADAMAVSQRDTYLPVVPFFHAQAWALPFSALLAGSRMVLCGANVAPECIARLVESEKVTLASGVPTIWRVLLNAIESDLVTAASLTPLERIVCGGSAVPQNMLRDFDQLGVQLIQVWGMTEMSPLGTVSRVRTEVEAGDALQYRAMQGQPSPLVSLKIVDEDGLEQPWDGEQPGEILVSGPWIADAYLDPEASDLRMDAGGFETDAQGRRWLRTGDIATVNPLANVHLVDRKKDLIKSGGEWISSIWLEQILESHEAVSACAVIAKPHPKWGERPLAIVEVKTGYHGNKSELLELVRKQVAPWQVPDELIFVDELPRNSLGKIDKRVLRETHGAGT